MSDEAPATLDDVTPLFLSRFDPEETLRVFLQAQMDPVPFVKVKKKEKKALFFPGMYKLQIYCDSEVTKLSSELYL